MALTWEIVAAVLSGALLHAGWNALVKSGADKELHTAVQNLAGTALVLPLLLVIGLPPAAAWPYVAASVTIHVGYYMTLTGAYRHGDLGLTYPLMRGTAPVLVALAAGSALGESLSAPAWGGIAAVCGGVLLLGLSRHALERPAAIGFALANACIIALYTVVDATGVRAAASGGGHSLQYSAMLFAFNGLPFALIVLSRRGWAKAWPAARASVPLAAAGALASFASYAIALWAMTRAPVAVVAALRETSVLFAALIGVLLLGERFNGRRVFGTAVIVAGVVALRLSPAA